MYLRLTRTINPWVNYMGDETTIKISLAVSEEPADKDPRHDFLFPKHFEPGKYARVIQVDGNGNPLCHHFRSGHKAVFTKGMDPIYPAGEAEKVLQEVLDDPATKPPEHCYKIEDIGYVGMKRLEFLQSDEFDRT